MRSSSVKTSSGGLTLIIVDSHAALLPFFLSQTSHFENYLKTMQKNPVKFQQKFNHIKKNLWRRHDGVFLYWSQMKRVVFKKILLFKGRLFLYLKYWYMLICSCTQDHAIVYTRGMYILHSIFISVQVNEEKLCNLLLFWTSYLTIPLGDSKLVVTSLEPTLSKVLPKANTCPMVLYNIY